MLAIVFCGYKTFAQNSPIELYFVDPLNYSKPSSLCGTEACQSLLREINWARESIDFAIYGIGGEPKIFDALVRAQRRGVRVHGATDVNIKNRNPYPDTNNLIKKIQTIKTDYTEEQKTLNNLPDKYKKSFLGYIMHNKFFVIDNKTVWTGSTNVSSTCMSYNSNVSVMVRSPQLASLYTSEFEQMYDNKFHKSQIPLNNTENIVLSDGTKLSIYFSPKSTTLENGILPVINSSQEYLYVPIFYLSNPKIIEALINAKKRGVDVKIILDANSAGNYSKPEDLRAAGVALKIENWGGKMHMKSIIADDKYIIVGSTNFTNSALYQNDENLLVIENENLAKVFKQEFIRLWEAIPDKYLSQTPNAESPESTVSCFDGVDNNHNGKVDLDDENCRVFLKHGKKYIYRLNHLLPNNQPNFQTDD